MIPSETVREIRALLTQGDLSHRAIAQQTGVARGSVAAIQRREQSKDPLPRPVAEDFIRPLGPPKRCPTCGGSVYPPCRLCATRRLVADTRRRPPRIQRESPDDPLALDLRQDHRQRYHRIRALKLAKPE